MTKNPYGNHIREGEVMTPLRGVCDTQIRGEGIIDISEPDKGIIGLSLSFLDEGPVGSGDMPEYAEVELGTDYDTLVKDYGYDPEEAGWIVSATELLIKILRRRVYRGGKYGCHKE